MADIRIKDLPTTASLTASDDFIAIDGTTNGTRKLNSAAPSFLTSVTTPSLTSPAATNLTLGLGTGGTALTLADTTLAATFAGAVSVSGTITPSGSVHGANGTAANPSFAFNSDQNTGLYRIGADNIGVAANGAKVLDIATTGLTVTGAVTVAAGNLVIGTDGNGIDFSATAGTGTSELLNDYEEGTWDAAFVSGGGTVTINTASNRCRYTKIGRFVTVNGFLSVTSVSSPTGPLLITGLPFPIPAGTEGDAASAVSIFADNLEVTATGQIVGYGLVSSTNIYLYRYQAGTIIGLAPSVKAGSEITFTFTYSV